jgi:hypothetical protein
MKLNPALAAVVLSLSVMAGGANAATATTFNFRFDNNGSNEADGTIGTPKVGTGTFISPVGLGVGQYALTSLAGFSLSFTFGADTFSTSDVATPLDGVAVDITQAGAQERLVFTETASSDADGGPFNGSLDLVSTEPAALTFEPTFAGGHNLYAEFGPPNTNFGNYLALSVPEPTTWAMMLLGLGLAGAALRRRRPMAAA